MYGLRALVFSSVMIRAPSSQLVCTQSTCLFAAPAESIRSPLSVSILEEDFGLNPPRAACCCSQGEHKQSTSVGALARSAFKLAASAAASAGVGDERDAEDVDVPEGGVETEAHIAAMAAKASRIEIKAV